MSILCHGFLSFMFCVSSSVSVFLISVLRVRHVFLNCMFRILCFCVTSLCVVWRVSSGCLCDSVCV